MLPYLKGIHQALDSWRPNWVEDGWKLSHKEIAKRQWKKLWEPERTEPLTQVNASPRLKDGLLEALWVLLRHEHPPRWRMQSTHCLEVFYGCGDASATGHLTNFQTVINKGKIFELEDKSYYHYGHWCDEVSKASSNYWELLNLVELLESLN
jgi:hypothetical protein